MALLHLFNPENDIALAHGTAGFTPPMSAWRLRLAGEALPLWYGHDGDRFISQGIDARWLDNIRDRFGIDIDVFDHTPRADLHPAPWGWSMAARAEFIRAGYDRPMLPDDDLIGRMRDLSHRRTSIAISRRLQGMLRFKTAPAATETSDTGDVERFLDEHPFAFLKAPWSGSGRGVVDTSAVPRDKAVRQAREFIRSQGSVLMEVGIRKILDFAWLFDTSTGHYVPVGPSVFQTGRNGCYCGNILATGHALKGMITEMYPEEKLDETVSALAEAIGSIITPYYSGILGVDMMLGRDDRGEVFIDPVVEVNLRMTMGMVAARFSGRYLHPSSHGVFRVITLRPGTLLPEEDYETRGHRLYRGTLLLTPPNRHFAFVAQVAPV